MLSAKSVAEYILVQCEPSEEGEELAPHPDLISHLKLQKLLYYCQGFHLAIENSPLFSEKILHWAHGPVVKEVYACYKKFGANALRAPKGFDVTIIPDSARAVIDDVLTVYGQFSAWKLRDMTHAEPPWNKTDDCDEMTHDILKEYFISRLN